MATKLVRSKKPKLSKEALARQKHLLFEEEQDPVFHAGMTEAQWEATVWPAWEDLQAIAIRRRKLSSSAVFAHPVLSKMSLQDVRRLVGFTNEPSFHGLTPAQLDVVTNITDRHIDNLREYQQTLRDRRSVDRDEPPENLARYLAEE